jgi:O-antigen biosynthesis protein
MRLSTWARPRLAPPEWDQVTTTSRLPLPAPPTLSSSALQLTRVGPRAAPPSAPGLAVAHPSVLVLGVYLAKYPSHIRSLVANLSSTHSYRIVQRWVALGGAADDSAVGRVTSGSRPMLVPKFPLINELLARIDLRVFEYVVLVDDDVLLPDFFLDRFLAAQSTLGFCLAQPARTQGSYIDHAIVAQEPGSFARATRWVEVGPVVSIHHSIYELLFPFDLLSPMGWGYENVWAYKISQHGHTMGIIDALPVDHSLRPPHAHYDATEAAAACQRMLAVRPHLPLDECQQVLARWPELSAPVPGIATAPPQRVVLAQLRALLDEQAAAAGRSCWVLDWRSGGELAEMLRDQIVFAPADGPPARLPYFGKSVDLVVLASRQPEAFNEARRVARLAVAERDGCDELTLHWLSPPALGNRPSVSILIPTYNGAALVDDCLEALLPTLSAFLDVEVLVIDDGSCDDTGARVCAWSAREPRVRLLGLPRNQGFVRACNRGAMAARGEILVLLNNDTRPQPGWLEALLRTFALHPDAGAVGGKLLYPDGRLQEAGSLVFSDGSAANFGKGDPSSEAPLYNHLREVDYCSGALLATPRSLFFQLGTLDARYLPAYYEDTDYCFKVRAAGRGVYYQPESRVVHVEGATSGTDLHRGVKRFQSLHQARFREAWRDVLTSLPDRPRSMDPVAMRALATRPRGALGSERRALVCSPTLPEFDRESGSRRVLDHIEGLQATGWTVVFAAQQGDRASRYVRLLMQRGVETYCNFSEIDELVSTNHFHLALLAFWHVAEALLPSIRLLSPHTRVVVDSIDLHFLRNARRVKPGWDPCTAAPVDEAHRVEMDRELAVYSAADAVLTVSPREAEIVADLVAGALPLVMPDGEDLELSTVPWPERRGLVFLGNFRHPPNVEAVEYLCRAVLPLIAPAVRAHHPVYIVGNDLPAGIRALAADLPNVVMVGWVPSVVPYLAHGRVVLAPLLHGAGTKRKLIQALMVGAPTVATSLAIEGIPVHDGEHLLVGDDAPTFADAVVRLATDDALCQTLVTRGRRAVEPCHSRRAIDAGLAAVIERVFAQPRS